MTYARCVSFTVKTGKIDEFNRLMTTEILPLLKTEKGFCDAVTLLRGTTGMNISLWNDRASAETYNTKTYPEVLNKLHLVLEGTPEVDLYDTVLTTFPTVVHA